ncbi:T9SS type A sorting domain-containing protein [candidate division KSB1 bacterium]|nr:T9SS type A sorting domain-containing protein [candidate division KSB1 bacterium]
MKRILLTSIFAVIVVHLAFGQVTIDNFDSAEPDSIYWTSTEGAPSEMTLSADTDDFVEGTASLKVEATIGAFHPWGSFAQFGYTVPDTLPPMDWSISDSISIWLKVHQAPSQPEYMVFRIQLGDRPTADADEEQYIYENAVILDETSEWVELKVPLLERETDGTTVPNNEGFVLAPTTWGGFTYNNSELDRDKIVEWNIGLITSGWTDPDNIPQDSLVVSFDNFVRFGARATPFVFFNGKTIPTGITTWSWGQSAFGVEEGAGAIPNTNALKWTQGNEWGNGWSGVGMTIEPPYNMSGVWATDSIKFKMKAEEGVGPIRFQFEDGSAKVGTVFQPTADNQWHDYALKLSEMTDQDNTTGFDSSNVVVLGIMAEASAIAGKVIYIDDLWTGTPEIDVVNPEAPSGVGALASDFYNLVYWQDVPNETGETYTVYASLEPITTLESPNVDVVAAGVMEDIQSVAHWLVYPLVDKNLDYYYAVSCMDAAGNQSLAFGSNAQPVSNTAKGIPTISPAPPADFAVDGDFTEWQNAGIVPYVMTPENYFVSTGTVTDANDLTGTVYLAVDDDYLYIGVDCYDDVYNFGEGNWWEQDAFELFIGLYDQRGKKHGSPKRGAEPDYKFVMDEVSCREDFAGNTFYTTDDADYHMENFGGQDYVIETKIPLDSILAASDARFHPQRGQRIPLEITFHDNDGAGWEGNLVTSAVNTDNAYQTPTVWSNTWVGDTTHVVTGVKSDTPPAVAHTYRLDQNYPNPFNPTTKVSYTIANTGHVRLAIYNMLGQQVKTLVNERQAAGHYTLEINAHDLQSGIYFYRIETQGFTKTMKMILMK